jgi:hypothetical protein
MDQTNTELGRGASTQVDLNWLNPYIKSNLRPATPNLNSFRGLAYYQRNMDGNCTNNGANCDYNCNCNCGDRQCNNCANCTAVNCTNCDTQSWLQSNCNCACTYNCSSDQNCYSYNCNCSKIICTKLHELGLMPNHIFVADQMFGDELRKNDPEVYEGYVRWASVIVSGMEGTAPDFMFWVNKADRKEAEKKATIKWAQKVAKPWSEHMAFLMGVLPEDNNVGRIIMKLGRPLSKLAGKLPKNYKFGIVGSLALWFICPALYYTAVIVDKFQQTNSKEVLA